MLIVKNLTNKDENGVTSSSRVFGFTDLQNSWNQRRKSILFGQNKKYEYTFMIDTLLAECQSYANTSNFLKTGSYPPTSSHQLLELLVECNLTNDVKQMIFLYFLIDLKQNVSKVHVKKV
jgi:hypothetical protein